MEFQGRVPLPHQSMMPLRHHSFSIGWGCSWQHYTLGTGGRTKVYELAESLNWVDINNQEFRIWFDMVSIPFLVRGSPWFKAFKDRVSLSVNFWFNPISLATCSRLLRFDSQGGFDHCSALESVTHWFYGRLLERKLPRRMQRSANSFQFSWGDDPIWRAYFSRDWFQPPTSQSIPFFFFGSFFRWFRIQKNHLPPTCRTPVPCCASLMVVTTSWPFWLLTSRISWKKRSFCVSHMDELIQTLCLSKDEIDQGKFGSFAFFFYLDFQFLRVFNLNNSSQLNKFYRVFMLHMPGHLLDIFCHIQVSSVSIWPCSGFIYGISYQSQI